MLQRGATLRTSNSNLRIHATKDGPSFENCGGVVSAGVRRGGCARSRTGEGELTARRSSFRRSGPGLRAVQRGADGRTYVLASPSPGLVVFDAKGKQVFAIAEVRRGAGKARRHRGITFGEDCDVDAEGRIYVADRGANAVQVFSPDGTLLRSIPVAVAHFRSPRSAKAKSPSRRCASRISSSCSTRTAGTSASSAIPSKSRSART